MLELKHLTDKAQLKEVYRLPEVQRIGHDYRAPNPIEHPNVAYIGAYRNGEFVGAFMAVSHSPIEIELHALLTKKATHSALRLGRMIITLAFENPMIQRVTALVREGLDSVCDYCLRLGFKLEGILRSACQINGKLLGVCVLGMTRSDWEGASWAS